MGTRGLVTLKTRTRSVSVFSGNSSGPDSLGIWLLQWIDYNLLTPKVGKLASKPLKALRENLEQATMVEELPDDAYNVDNFLDKLLAGDLPKMVDERDFAKDGLFCNHHYVIDLERGMLHHYLHGTEHEISIRLKRSDIRRMDWDGNGGGARFTMKKAA